MSQEEQRHGRQLPLATSGVITFNGVALSPLTAGVESDGDDDVVIVDACNNGKRKAAAAARANTVVPVPQRAARGATAPTPRPVAPPQAGTWPLPAPAAMPPPPPPPTGAAAVAPPPSLKTWSWGDNVVVSVLGNIGNMTVRAPLRRTGVLAMASAALKRYNITAVTSLSMFMFMFYTVIDMPDRQPQFVHPKVFEAMYRAAAAEIAAWINCY
ncbi:CASP-like protein 4A1 [Oryza glaberrima]|uniref:CASP-like protein 4A1 n=1 Tax=Oryza glaberrima TaxID=4538 RepID=UPI00224C4F75|nr:CASP-like protein 4A1 [Oryza glaberrima]